MDKSQTSCLISSLHKKRSSAKFSQNDDRWSRNINFPMQKAPGEHAFDQRAISGFYLAARTLHLCVRLEAVGPRDRLICKVRLYSSVTLIIEPAPLREATAAANKHIIT